VHPCSCGMLLLLLPPPAPLGSLLLFFGGLHNTKSGEKGDSSKGRTAERCVRGKELVGAKQCRQAQKELQASSAQHKGCVHTRGAWGAAYFTKCHNSLQSRTRDMGNMSSRYLVAWFKRS
jgi:hypothetical protein